MIYDALTAIYRTTSAAIYSGGCFFLFCAARRTAPEAPSLLLLNEKLYDAIAAWAEGDFRSVNGQIEYLLTECVKQRKKDGKYVSQHLDEPPELDIH